MFADGGENLAKLTQQINCEWFSANLLSLNKKTRKQEKKMNYIIFGNKNWLISQYQKTTK